MKQNREHMSMIFDISLCLTAILCATIVQNIHHLARSAGGVVSVLNPKTHSPEYPDSYYVASQNLHLDCKPLTGTQQTEVCIIGGGFSGVNTAIELAERGASVTLLDAHRVGWGASGRNGGQLIRGLGEEVAQFSRQIGNSGVRALQLMGLEAVEIVKERINNYKIACDLTLGYCDLAHKPRDMVAFHEDQAWLAEVGYPYETRLVEQDDIYSVVGSDTYIGGLVDMGSGHLHPLNLNLGEAAAALQLGVQIFEQSKVTAIDYGSTISVHTDSAVVHCDKLVICGNAYVAGLNKRLESKVLPAGSYIIATEPLSESQYQRVLPQNMAVCDQRVALDYYRLSADKRLLFGGLCTYSGRDPRSITASLRPHLLKVFPYLKDVQIAYQWGGMIGIGANRMPQVGRLAENVYYAQAYAGHGVNATHMAARLIAEHLYGESERLLLLERIRHPRFPGGSWLRSPLLAAGMLYYRAKDLW